MDYVVDEEQYTFQPISSHTDYLRTLYNVHNHREPAVMHVDESQSRDIRMRESNTKRDYTVYTDQDKARFFKLMFEKVLSASAAAKQLGMHVHSAQRWALQYEQDPDSLFKKRKSSGRPRVLSDKHKRSILEWVDENPSIVLEQLMEKLPRRFEGIQVSKTTLYRFAGLIAEIGRGGFAMSSSQQQRIIALVYNCFLCPETEITAAQNLMKHLNRTHNLDLPARAPGTKHRNTTEFAYIRHTNTLCNPAIENHHACPSCFSHFVEKGDLKIHVQKEHVKERPQNDEQDSTTIDSLHVPYQPKLSAETIAKLKSMAMIWTSFNKNISDKGKVILDAHLVEQRSLATLKSFPKVFDLLSCALDKSLTELPTFLFNCEHLMDIEEKQLFKVVQFVLTVFAGKCYRAQMFKPKSERTL
ncbi:hypothetical protein G6F56_002048 [Rhizopus delemar]|nr:hypothetical protein G6F56_002048 [Rhizopus delemar]